MTPGRFLGRFGLLFTRLLLSWFEARATGEYSPLAPTCSSASQADEAALANLEHAATQLAGRHVEALGRQALTIELDAAL